MHPETKKGIEVPVVGQTVIVFVVLLRQSEAADQVSLRVLE